MLDYFAIRWADGFVRILDQRLLPGEVVYRDLVKADEVADAIQTMTIRGAPAIGIAAGFGLALTAFHSLARNEAQLAEELYIAADQLRKSRPTAVNLSWAVDRIMNRFNGTKDPDVTILKEIIVQEALKIADGDARMNLRIAKNGQRFIPDSANIIHHCNTGTLATGGYGTALGVIRYAHEQGKKVHVYVDETRPRMQGARLTAWELQQLGIPHTIIVDGASGYIMRHHKIDACLVGCDRIAANGDVANKIGTYNLALVARAHGVPFFSAGPLSTIDLKIPNGEAIPIEERTAQEITHIAGIQITPAGAVVTNPAFDVTPAEYLTGIITDAGVAFPPYEKSLQELMEHQGETDD